VAESFVDNRNFATTMGERRVLIVSVTRTGISTTRNSSPSPALSELDGRLGIGLLNGTGIGWSTLNVNCIRVIVPGLLLRLASRLRSFSKARCLINSVEWLRLKPGASSSSMLLFLVQVVAHMFGEFLKLTLRFGVIRVNDKVLKMPESPTQIWVQIMGREAREPE